MVLRSAALHNSTMSTTSPYAPSPYAPMPHCRLTVRFMHSLSSLSSLRVRSCFLILASSRSIKIKNKDLTLWASRSIKIKNKDLTLWAGSRSRTFCPVLGADPFSFFALPFRIVGPPNVEILRTSLCRPRVVPLNRRFQPDPPDRPLSTIQT